ncbi:MAG: peptidoglycan-binding protein, partial [Acidobacteria bacterium]|nr:peptidoglycan-binding protein [Acidobacteriota bacterium]
MKISGQVRWASYVIVAALSMIVAASPLDAQAPSSARRARPGVTAGAARRVEGVTLQVRLDRAGFSSGVIDGQPGRKTTAALTQFQEARGLEASGTLDDATRQALGDEPGLMAYTVTPEDIAG